MSCGLFLSRKLHFNFCGPTQSHTTRGTFVSAQTIFGADVENCNLEPPHKQKNTKTEKPKKKGKEGKAPKKQGNKNGDAQINISGTI